MVALYVPYGYGPWMADDAGAIVPILADGVFQGPVLVGHQTLDGLGRELRSAGIGDDDDVYVRRILRGDEPHGTDIVGSHP